MRTTQTRQITLIALGSQGDVRPMVALGGGLKRAGHAVRVAANDPFADLITSEGLDFARLSSGDVRAGMRAMMAHVAEHGQNPTKMIRMSQDMMRAMATDWSTEALAACADADLIVGGGSAATPSALIAASLAEKLDLPFVQAYLSPTMLATNFPFGDLPKWGNTALHHFLMIMFWRGLAPTINDGRRTLGLRPYSWIGPQYRLRREQRPILFAFSPQIVPSTGPCPEHIKVPGYWFLDRSNWTPPQALVDFLAAGPKPIYVGFGSLPSQNAEATTRAVLDALRQTARRAVLATGWGGLADLTYDESLRERVLIIDEAPHDWLFPRVELAVHHGGAGTTAAAVGAGIPSVVAPFFGDQPFWAARLEQLGVAPASVPQKDLTADRLAVAIQAASSDTMRATAAELGQRIRAEDGVATAISALREWRLI